MARVIIGPESSDNIRNLVELALENQLRVLTVGIAKTKSKLSEFERENGMESSAFYQEFGQGKLGDDFKYMRWAGEYETLKRSGIFPERIRRLLLQTGAAARGIRTGRYLSGPVLTVK